MHELWVQVRDVINVVHWMRHAECMSVDEVGTPAARQYSACWYRFFGVKGGKYSQWSR